MIFKFSELTEEVLDKLYQEFGFTAKEIGGFVGLGESSILLRLKKLSGKKQIKRALVRSNVSVEYTGKSKIKKDELTKEKLEELYNLGKTDKAIGDFYGLTGEGVAYRRKKFGINVQQKFSEKRQAFENLKKTPKDQLMKDYYNLNYSEFSKKYSLSRTVWFPYLRSLGIQDKDINRIQSYPTLTKEQNSLIIGSLLGDAGITREFSLYESHSLKQEEYLRSKYRILKPYSARIVPCDEGSGLRMNTISHPNFKIYRELFYDSKYEGKMIPVDFIMENWDDFILATWFFDDGYIDDTLGEITIANKCPLKLEIDNLVERINNHYGWKIHSGTQGYK